MKVSKDVGKDVEMFQWILEAIPRLASSEALNQKSKVRQHVHMWPNVASQLWPLSPAVWVHTFPCGL